MWHDYGYFEGEKLGKPYDVRLMRRFLRYVRPYTPVLIITSFIILIATAADLTLPYLTKVAVDRYIVVSHQLLETGESPDGDVREIIERNRALLKESGRAGVFFLSREGAREIDPIDLAKLKRAGAVKDGTFYLVENRPGPAWDTAAEKKDLFRYYPDAAIIAIEDMGKLSDEEISRIRSNDTTGLAWVALAAVAVLLIGYVFEFLQSILLEYAGQNLTHDLRQDLLTHVLRQSASFHDRTTTGRLVARLTNDVQNLNEMIKTVAETFFKDAFILVGIAAMLLYLNYKLALVTFALLPPIILATMIFRKKARDVFREQRAKVSQINSVFSETIVGIRIIQAFRREKHDKARFAVLNHENYKVGMRQIRVFGFFMPLIEVMSSTALALIVWYGGAGVIRETMTLGAVVAFIGYTRKFFQPIRDLAEKYNILQSAMASLERIFNLLDYQSAMPEKAEPAPMPDGPGTIEFENVSFSYTGGEEVLHDVSFRIEPGKTLAIVGPTGAGKTSIINLLLRFYDVNSGRVLVDGVDVRELDLSAHRGRMGLVMQEVFLFAGTIRENIALSREELDDARIVAAAEEVGADVFIKDLPRQYDQRLGEGGISLSVGQRQLLSFARVLARDPQILVLDEATAFIDSETEKLIESALERLTSGRTSIVIAHRLSTVRRADKILVMNRGRVFEIGSHEELMARQGLYYSLHQLQFQENSLVPETDA